MRLLSWVRRRDEHVSERVRRELIEERAHRALAETFELEADLREARVTPCGLTRLYEVCGNCRSVLDLDVHPTVEGSMRRSFRRIHARCAERCR